MSNRRTPGADFGLSDILEGRYSSSRKNNNELVYINISKLAPSNSQPRTVFDPDLLAQLSISIKASGVLQPILVRKISENSFEIIAGERRWRAAKLAQLETIPCLILNADDKESAIVSLVENIQRQQLNPIDEATSYKKIIDGFEYTQEEFSDLIGKPRPSVSNMIRLLNLVPEAQKLLKVGFLSMGHGKILLGCSPDQQRELVEEMKIKKMTVKELEKTILRKSKRNKTPPSTPTVSFEKELLETLVSNFLGEPVSVEIASRNGKTSIKFSSGNILKEFIKIFEKLN